VRVTITWLVNEVVSADSPLCKLLRELALWPIEQAPKLNLVHPLHIDDLHQVNFCPDLRLSSLATQPESAQWSWFFDAEENCLADVAELEIFSVIKISFDLFSNVFLCDFWMFNVSFGLLKHGRQEIRSSHLICNFRD
jgi:hypothetical protein